MGLQGPGAGRGAECCGAFRGPFEGGPHYLHYLHHSLVSGQITGRKHSPTHQQKIGLKTYRALPGEASITSDVQMAPPLWQKVKRN